MKKTVLTPTEARQGSNEHVVRYMLAGSLGFLVLALLLVLAIGRLTGLRGRKKPARQAQALPAIFTIGHSIAEDDRVFEALSGQARVDLRVHLRQVLLNDSAVQR